MSRSLTSGSWHRWSRPFYTPVSLASGTHVPRADAPERPARPVRSVSPPSPAPSDAPSLRLHPGEGALRIWSVPSQDDGQARGLDAAEVVLEHLVSSCPTLTRKEAHRGR